MVARRRPGSNLLRPLASKATTENEWSRCPKRPGVSDAPGRYDPVLEGGLYSTILTIMKYKTVCVQFKKKIMGEDVSSNFVVPCNSIP